MNKVVRRIALVLLFFNGISALFGGGMLIYDSSGRTLQMPIEWLQGTVFQDFLTQGIILFTTNGVLSILIAILTLGRVKNFQYFIILQGCILTGWLTIEILILKLFYLPLHGPYYFTGLGLIISGILLLKGKDKSA